MIEGVLCVVFGFALLVTILIFTHVSAAVFALVLVVAILVVLLVGLLVVLTRSFSWPGW